MAFLFVANAAVPLPAEVGMSDDVPDGGGTGEQIQAAEREAARRRILELAEAERIPVEETTRAVPERRWRRGQR